jgi:hypothetical protein
MLQEVILAMKKEHFSKGKKIIKQGDAGGTDFYVLVEGVCEVKKVRPPPHLTSFPTALLKHTVDHKPACYPSPLRVRYLSADHY